VERRGARIGSKWARQTRASRTAGRWGRLPRGPSASSAARGQTGGPPRLLDPIPAHRRAASAAPRAAEVRSWHAQARARAHGAARGSPPGGITLGPRSTGMTTRAAARPAPEWAPAGRRVGVRSAPRGTATKPDCPQAAGLSGRRAARAPGAPPHVGARFPGTWPPPQRRGGAAAARVRCAAAARAQRAPGGAGRAQKAPHAPSGTPGGGPHCVAPPPAGLPHTQPCQGAGAAGGGAQSTDAARRLHSSACRRRASSAARDASAGAGTPGGPGAPRPTIPVLQRAHKKKLRAHGPARARDRRGQAERQPKQPWAQGSKGVPPCAATVSGGTS
jgi:hypothetical protein